MPSSSRKKSKKIKVRGVVKYALLLMLVVIATSATLMLLGPLSEHGFKGSSRCEMPGVYNDFNRNSCYSYGTVYNCTSSFDAATGRCTLR